MSSVSGVKRVRFSNSPGKREKNGREPYFVEMPDEEEKGDPMAFITVKQQAYEGFLVEELEKVSLKRRMEEEWELPGAKRVKKDLHLVIKVAEVKNHVDKKCKGKSKKKKNGKGKLKLDNLVDVPTMEIKTSSRFELLALIPADYVFSAEDRSCGCSSTTTQEP